MKKYTCPICKRPISDYGEFCCGYKVVTPEGAAVEWGCFKTMILVIGIPLMLFALVGIGFMAVGQFRAWRNTTRTVNTGLTLPLTTTNTTVIYNNSGNVTHYITPDGEFRMITRGGHRQPDVVTVVDTDVRSIELTGHTTFYIKNDNSLWGFGRNTQGLLGTGTGVDVEEPVKILGNVAKLFIATIFDGGHRVFALGTDKSLWLWGRGEFSPIQVAEGVVDVIPDTQRVTIKKSDGLFFHYRINNDELERIHPFAMLDFVGNILGSREGFYINNENALIHLTWTGGGGLFNSGRRRRGNEITQNVQSLWGNFRSSSDYNLHLIKNDSTLWGFGTNASGELGDGTRVPRVSSPVKIAENVASVGSYYFLTTDGELWIWNRDNPTPEKLFYNVATVLSTSSGVWRPFHIVMLLNDGTLMTIYDSRSIGGNITRHEEIVHYGIKIPQMIVFE